MYLIGLSDELIAALEKVVQAKDREVLQEAVHQAIRDYIENISND